MQNLILVLFAMMAQAAAAETTWLTPDFQVITLDRAVSSPPVFTTDCRAKIAQAVCLVDFSTKGDDPLDRECLPASKPYAQIFEATYDRLPPPLQKMYCRLERIFIENKFEATAYAGMMQDKNGVSIGAIMGVRQDFVDQLFTLDHWSTWKEQLNFGGDPSNYSTSPTLPKIHSSDPDMMLFVVAHEFGHMFDFANKLNSSGSWTQLSWSGGAPKPGNDFPLRSSLCFYWCGSSPIDPAKAIDVYNGLFSTNFISIYAASNYHDDWAETLAYYTLNREFNATYDITLADGKKFDAMAHLNSPKMNAKVNYLEQLFKRGPKYPGDN